MRRRQAARSTMRREDEAEAVRRAPSRSPKDIPVPPLASARDGETVFVTAAFGAEYHRICRAMIRSFRRHNPDAPLVVFTDKPAAFGPKTRAEVVLGDPDGVVARWGPFYADGRRRNVFKFHYMREVHRQADLTTCWLDADTLVFDDLRKYFPAKEFAVLSHGRRGGEKVDCGNGVVVPGERYCMSGVFSVGDPAVLDHLLEVTAARPKWSRTGAATERLGDQLVLNHGVAKFRDQVLYVSDDRTKIFNLEFCAGVHPDVGDRGLAALRARRGRLYLGRRQLVLLNWIRRYLSAHVRDGFSTFHPDVRRMMKEFYR